MTECHELSMPVSVFESIEACTAERRFALADVRSQALHVVGERLAVDPALEDDYDQIVWTVHPDGSLRASLDVAGMVVASDGTRPEKDYLNQQ